MKKFFFSKIIKLFCFSIFFQNNNTERIFTSLRIDVQHTRICSPFANHLHTRTRVHDWKNKQKQAKNTIFSRHFWTPKIVKKWGFPQKKWGQNWKIIKSLREKVQNSLNYISWTYQGKLARFVEMIEKTQDFTNYGGGSFWKSSYVWMCMNTQIRLDLYGLWSCAKRFHYFFISMTVFEHSDRDLLKSVEFLWFPFSLHFHFSSFTQRILFSSYKLRNRPTKNPPKPP